MLHYCLVILEWCKFNDSITLVHIVLLFFRVLVAPLRSLARSMPATISCCQPLSPSLCHIYHIGLGGGGNVFQHIGLWERMVLDIKL